VKGALNVALKTKYSVFSKSKLKISEKVTLSEAKTISNKPSNVTDIPTAGPLMTPINGLEKPTKALTKFLYQIETSC